MNDMSSQVHNGELLQYANVTALICTSEDYCEVLNHVTADLHHITNLISSNKMQLNIAKSRCNIGTLPLIRNDIVFQRSVII